MHTRTNKGKKNAHTAHLGGDKPARKLDADSTAKASRVPEKQRLSARPSECKVVPETGELPARGIFSIHMLRFDSKLYELFLH